MQCRRAAGESGSFALYAGAFGREPACPDESSRSVQLDREYYLALMEAGFGRDQPGKLCIPCSGFFADVQNTSVAGAPNLLWLDALWGPVRAPLRSTSLAGLTDSLTYDGAQGAADDTSANGPWTSRTDRPWVLKAYPDEPPAGSLTTQQWASVVANYSSWRGTAFGSGQEKCRQALSDVTADVTTCPATTPDDAVGTYAADCLPPSPSSWPTAACAWCGWLTVGVAQARPATR